MPLSKKKHIVIYALLGILACLSGYLWISKDVTPEQQLTRAAAAKLGITEEELENAGTLVEKARAQGSLSQADRQEVERLLASDSPDLRRYGLIALDFGLNKSDPRAVVDSAELAMKEKDDRLRASAVRILYERNPDEWDRYAAELRSDPSKAIRDMVAELSVLDRQTAPTDAGEAP